MNFTKWFGEGQKVGPRFIKEIISRAADNFRANSLKAQACIPPSFPAAADYLKRLKLFGRLTELSEILDTIDEIKYF